MTPLEKKIVAGLTGTVGTGLLYNNYRNMQLEAAKENDPIETTLDGLEKYVLDPVGKLSPTQGIALASTLAAIPTVYGGYKAVKKYRGSRKATKREDTKNKK